MWAEGQRWVIIWPPLRSKLSSHSILPFLGLGAGLLGGVLLEDALDDRYEDGYEQGYDQGYDNGDDYGGGDF